MPAMWHADCLLHDEQCMRCIDGHAASELRNTGPVQSDADIAADGCNFANGRHSIV